MAAPQHRNTPRDPQDPYALLEHCLSADRPRLRRDLRRLPKRPRSLDELPEALRLAIASDYIHKTDKANQ